MPNKTLSRFDDILLLATYRLGKLSYKNIDAAVKDLYSGPPYSPLYLNRRKKELAVLGYLLKSEDSATTEDIVHPISVYTLTVAATDHLKIKGLI
jgi:hypothetical protein